MARLTIVLLGHTLDLRLEPTAAEVEDDTARDLSGGTLGAERIEAGSTDWHMGFTNGREDPGE